MPTFALKQFVRIILVVVSFIILAVILVSFKLGSAFYYLGCEGNLGGKSTKLGYANPLCTIYEEFSSCEYAYENITRHDESLPVCVWSPTPDENEPDCFLNPRLACDDFSQVTVPKCQDVKDCRPVSAIKAAVERMKPW